MEQFYSVSLEDGSSTKLGEEPVASEWSDTVVFLKLSNNDLYEMEEDGEWRLIG